MSEVQLCTRSAAALFFGTLTSTTYPAHVTAPGSDLKTKEAAPQFGEVTGDDDGLDGGDDGLEVASKPVRDPSLDTLLEGLGERLDHERPSAKRVHTPPNARTDPFSEQPVVAPHMTAPLSVQKARKRPASVRVVSERPPRKMDEPTFLVVKPARASASAYIIGALSCLALLGALGVTAWGARNRVEPSDGPRADPPPMISAPALPTVPSSSASSGLPAGLPSAQSVQTAPSSAHAKPPSSQVSSPSHGSSKSRPAPSGPPSKSPGYQYPD